MPFDAKVFKVMIASPSDVPDARQRMREAIYNWNTVNATHRGAVLLPVDWENWVVPDLTGRPQAVVNQQLGICDLLIGVFWTRLGTPTGTSASGTTEEIQRHVDARRPVLLYFCTKSVPHDADLGQLQAVRDAKARYQAEGITDAYDSQDDLGSKLDRHLSMKMNVLLASSPASSMPAGQPAPTLSEQAITLLRETAQDRTGLVLVVSSQGAKSVQTNGKLLCDGTNARESARWVAAVESLVFARLFVHASSSGNAFKITDRGYQFVETL
jgi:hypothetical protein